MIKKVGAQIHITGVVQGVGFRPFIYNLAVRYDLKGWVRNTSAGVDIYIDGPEKTIQAFIAAIHKEIPPLARINSLQSIPQPPNGYTKFAILPSESIPGAFQPISPDMSICDDCLRELMDPRDRRYLYPFINCTNCGPRFTIIKDIPYDRPQTTMAGFALCAECNKEYHDPRDRRFHAQPVACPDCGPHIWLQPSSAHLLEHFPPVIPRRLEALRYAIKFLRDGRILAIKGLGGFHLACDATNPTAVQELRQRKKRVAKAFALMMPDLETVAQHCHLTASERSLLLSPQRPIVILPRKTGSTIARGVAPGQDTLGVMLPYTPLHYLLFLLPPAENPLQALVMTSGNLSEEPIVTDNEQALLRLAPLADGFLLHDRPIHIRCDDSVVRPAYLPGLDKTIQPATPPTFMLRRARGYAPGEITLPWSGLQSLASGGELKNTFGLLRDRSAFISHHIGDLQNYETWVAFEKGVVHYEKLFKIQPEALFCDLHPDYLSTRYAKKRAEMEHLPLVAIQHHHAHIAACMADNDLPPDEQVIGVAFDGTGYGTDGAIWGGEFLLASYQHYRRAAHLSYMPLPGGDAAVRKPARTALAYLWQSGVDWESALTPVETLCPEERNAIRSQLQSGINTPETSSMGRLFDAVAAIVGVCQESTYEAQAAIELEALVRPGEQFPYPFDIQVAPAPGKLWWTVDPAPLIRAVAADTLSSLPAAVIAARFHAGVVAMVEEVCLLLRERSNLNAVALSGGVWQNMTLFQQVYQRLSSAGFEVYYHRRVPPNDGGIALGQLAVGSLFVKNGR